jgi:hypothetical protein
MQAQIYVTDRAQGVFPEGAEIGKSFLEVVVQSVNDMVDKERVSRPRAEKIIIAGNDRAGFADIDTTRLEGIIPYMGGTCYNYGHDNSILKSVLDGLGRAVQRDEKHGQVLVLAPTVDIAYRCMGVLQEKGYQIEKVGFKLIT